MSEILGASEALEALEIALEDSTPPEVILRKLAEVTDVLSSGEVVHCSGHSSKETLTDVILSNLEENWLVLENLFINGSFEVRTATIGVLLACSEALPGAELLSLACLCKASFPPPPKRKKSKKKKKKKGTSDGQGPPKKKLEEEEQYWTLAQAAVQTAKSLISILLANKHGVVMAIRATKSLTELTLPTTWSGLPRST